MTPRRRTVSSTPARGKRSGRRSAAGDVTRKVDRCTLVAAPIPV